MSALRPHQRNTPELLYWVNVPLIIFMQIMLKIAETVDDD